MSTGQPTVVYRLLPDDPGYRVGTDGTVWTCLVRRGASASGKGGGYVLGDTWKPLKLTAHGGYRAVCVRGRFVHVHRLVLETFVGPCPPGMECCHEDDDRGNNVLSNLRWDTPKANAADRERNGRQPRGESSPRSKLTADDVRAIRREHAAGKSMKRIAKERNIDASQVSNIVHRRQWAHVV
jgi:hypothetical protein